MIVTQTALIFYFGQDEIDSVKDKVWGFNDTGLNMYKLHVLTCPNKYKFVVIIELNEN